MKAHKHTNDTLVEIYASVQNEFEETVVRWCPICGAIVVDTDFDGRTKPGAVMSMRVPTNAGGRG